MSAIGYELLGMASVLIGLLAGPAFAPRPRLPRDCFPAIADFTPPTMAELNAEAST